MTPSLPRPVVDPVLLNGPGATTQWANLGCWKDATAYADAAVELARRVGRAAKLGPGDVVLDLACGHGDSCALWVREFGVARVVGVEPDPALVVEVTQRMRALGLADRVVLRAERAERALPSALCPGVTAVVCVDAAYHFDTRTAWLTTLAKDVPRGTRLGFSDLIVSTRTRHGRRMRAFARRARLPLQNLWAGYDIEPVLADAGWGDDTVYRIGRDVLGGFVRHALRSALAWATRPARGGWRALATAAAIVAAQTSARLDYVIVGATRR